MNPYTIEQQVQELHAAGLSIRSIALNLGIHKSRVQRTLRKLLESSIMESDTEKDTPSDTAYQAIGTASGTPVGTADTRSGTRADTFSDTAFQATGTASDTHPDTAGKPRPVPMMNLRPPVHVERTLTLGEVRHLFGQIAIFKKEYNTFVSAMINLHDGTKWAYDFLYPAQTKEVDKLSQWADRILDYLEAEGEELLVHQVLNSIEDTIEGIVTGRDIVNRQTGLIRLDDRVRSQQFWVDSLEEGFLAPAIDFD